MRVCIAWTEGQFANEEHVRLFHREDSSWVDITDVSSRDTANNTLCGVTSSFSPFALMEVKYPFVGFFQPVDNPPLVELRQGRAAVPVKFSLGGDLGLGHLRAGLSAVGSSSSVSRDWRQDDVEITVTAGGSTLNYDPLAGQYIYVWKTNAAWAGSCRELQVKFNDGEQYAARFNMRK